MAILSSQPGDGGGPGPGPAPCVPACKAPQVCQNGVCKTPTALSCTQRKVGCRNLCNDPQNPKTPGQLQECYDICDRDYIECTGGQPQCQGDEDCQTGYTCSNGNCIKIKGWCNKPEDCPEGQDCVNHKCQGKAVCTPNAVCSLGGTECGTGKCVGATATVKGKCDCSTGACSNGTPCSGSPTNNPQCGGKWCRGGKCECSPSVCVDGAVCQDTISCAGKPCVNNKCQCTGETECIEGPGIIKHEGCPCNAIWNTKTGKCPTGYQFIKRIPTKWASELPYTEGSLGTCECTAWMTFGGGTTGEYKYPKNLYKNTPGEYGYPSEMQNLMSLLLSRGKEFLGMPTGLSPEAQAKMFGQGFENLRTAEAGQREQLEQGLSRQGMLGTGAGQGMLNNLAWQTEGNISDLARELFVQNELKKKQDLLDYTNAAQGVMGTGLGYEGLLENINAGRRGETRSIESLIESINSGRRSEGLAAMMALLQWLLSQG